MVFFVACTLSMVTLFIAGLIQLYYDLETDNTVSALSLTDEEVDAWYKNVG